MVHWGCGPRHLGNPLIAQRNCTETLLDPAFNSEIEADEQPAMTSSTLGAAMAAPDCTDPSA
jgi:hypothetical protein